MDDATRRLVERLGRKYDFFKRVRHDEGEHETMVLLREAAAALEAAQRLPVSPEVRERMARVLFDAWCGPQAFSPWLAVDEPVRERFRGLADAILARFSFPILDVEG